MKKRSYCLISLLILVSCSNHRSNELVIRSNGDTINLGTDFMAELFIPYHSGFLPAFKIIRGPDTSWLPIDTIKKCAVLKAASNRSGKREYNGIVEYIDLKGNRKLEKFSIKYYVKPKS